MPTMSRNFRLSDGEISDIESLGRLWGAKDRPLGRTDVIRRCIRIALRLEEPGLHPPKKEKRR